MDFVHNLTKVKAKELEYPTKKDTNLKYIFNDEDEDDEKDES